MLARSRLVTDVDRCRLKGIKQTSAKRPAMSANDPNPDIRIAMIQGAFRWPDPLLSRQGIVRIEARLS